MTETTDISRLKSETEGLMDERISKLHDEFGKIRTGRAAPQMLDPIQVEYYGSLTPLKAIAAIAAPEARVLEIRPFDPSAMGAIETAIAKSDIEVQPQSDGKVIRLVFPSMTEERRKDGLKMVKKIAEDFRVAIRGHRRDAIDRIKKAEKAKSISEDDRKREEDVVQKVTDAKIKKIDEMLAAKEKEISTI